MFKNRSLLSVGMLLACLLFAAGTARAATFTVTNTTDCATSGCGSLRQAVIDANATAGADTINFAAGVTGTITLGGTELDIDDASNAGLTIDGPGANVLTVSGNNASRVFRVRLGEPVTISGLTIANGNVGIFSGGGINSQGTLTLIDCTLSGNNGGAGGGIFNAGTLTLTNCTVSGNTASAGGAIYSSGGTVTVMNSTISGNTVAFNGVGGGFYIQDDTSSLTVINSTISGNSATNLGGGIYNESTINLSNSTIVNNSSPNGGGFFRNNTGTLNSKNSIIANSPSGGDCSGGPIPINALGVNYATDSTCTGFTQVTSAQLDLGALALNPPGTTSTHALGTGSVAIDAVTDCTTVALVPVTTDQRGVTRPQGSACDAGSFELEMALTPAQMIAALGETVQSYGLHHGTETALLAKLNAALAALANGNTNAARGNLQAFINQVNAQRGKKITQAQADELIAAANEILDALE